MTGAHGRARGRSGVLEDGMTLPVGKVVVWLLVGLAVVYLVSAPEQAAGLLRDGVGALADLGSALVAFVRSLF
jgi:hypothetical protein